MDHHTRGKWSTHGPKYNEEIESCVYALKCMINTRFGSSLKNKQYFETVAHYCWMWRRDEANNPDIADDMLCIPQTITKTTKLVLNLSHIYWSKLLLISPIVKTNPCVWPSLTHWVDVLSFVSVFWSSFVQVMAHLRFVTKPIPAGLLSSRPMKIIFNGISIQMND